MTAGSQRFLSFICIYVCWASLEGGKKDVFCISAQDISTHKGLFIMYIALFCVASTRVRKEKKKGRSPVHYVKRIEDKLLPERNPTKSTGKAQRYFE